MCEGVKFGLMLSKLNFTSVSSLVQVADSNENSNEEQNWGIFFTLNSVSCHSGIE